MAFAIGTWPRSFCFPIGSRALGKRMNEQIDDRSLEKTNWVKSKYYHRVEALLLKIGWSRKLYGNQHLSRDLRV